MKKITTLKEAVEYLSKYNIFVLYTKPYTIYIKLIDKSDFSSKFFNNNWWREFNSDQELIDKTNETIRIMNMKVFW